MPIKGDFTPYDMERLQKAINYIHLHFKENISADSLAEEVRMDIKLLQSLMQFITGMTVHNYLLKTRVAQALIDLANFKRSIASIALNLGFSDHGHFDRVFKKFTNQTPTQYRSQLIRNGNYLDNEHENNDKNSP